MEPSEFKFPVDIHLINNPLLEAWLDIRWELSPSEQFPNSLIDHQYPFALGVFYQNISSRFSESIELPINAVPIDAAPYNVRYRFKQSTSESPLLQLGPGVATVNFTQNYDWLSFKEEALYLREKLTTAYSNELNLKHFSLKYKNAFKFDYFSNDILEFLKDNLNIQISLPAGIPGNLSKNIGPSNWQSSFSFEISEPNSVGTIRFMTGLSESNIPVVIMDLEIAGTKDKLPDLNSKTSIEEWMDSAHRLIHEWFFSLIEGDLRKEYEQ